MAGKNGKGGLREARERWERDILAPVMSKARDRRPRFESTSGEEVRRFYTPEDLASFDYLRDAGFPGEFPFTRGVQPTMYRGRFWTMRQYAGFGDAKESNRRYRYLLDNGQTGLSVAFDLPTQMGYDSDAPMSFGEVGKVGVAIDSLEDMEVLFDRIPLGKVSTSMTINSTAAILLAMYIAVGEKQGVAAAALNGTIQNDILKEYIARGRALLLRHGDVHRDQHRRRGIDRHRRAHLVERDAVEEQFHVLDRVDGDADLADLRLRDRIVRVEPDLRRQVERGGEAGLPLREQEAEALVGLLRGAVAGVLARGPELATVHRRLDAAREGVLAGVADVALVVRVRDVERRVEPLDGPDARLERGLALRAALQRGLQHLALPALALGTQVVATAVAAAVAHGTKYSPTYRPPSPQTRL